MAVKWKMSLELFSWLCSTAWLFIFPSKFKGKEIQAQWLLCACGHDSVPYSKHDMLWLQPDIPASPALTGRVTSNVVAQAHLSQPLFIHLWIHSFFHSSVSLFMVYAECERLGQLPQRLYTPTGNCYKHSISVSLHNFHQLKFCLFFPNILQSLF